LEGEISYNPRVDAIQNTVNAIHATKDDNILDYNVIFNDQMIGKVKDYFTATYIRTVLLLSCHIYLGIRKRYF